MTISSSKSLRVCCYGSSSDRTPEKYKSEAYILGSLLASRGHVCVNGAGSYGCMGAMNEGAAAADGRIVGVIHGMFEVDGDDAHPVFKNATEDDDKIQLVRAYGDDLQERKKLLIKDADALMVLPGGAGTWDELWEMACAINVGFSSLRMVCVNVDGFYEPFRMMLERAEQDQLLYKKPEDIFHFEPTALAAINWIEAQLGDKKTGEYIPTIKKRRTVTIPPSV